MKDLKMYLGKAHDLGKCDIEWPHSVVISLVDFIPRQMINQRWIASSRTYTN